MLLIVLKPLAFYWQAFVLICGIIRVFSTRDRDNEAAAWAAYFAGMEVLIRMTGESLFWEIGKYGVILLLSTGLVISKRNYKLTYLLYFLLLLPSIVIANYQDWSQARDMLSFNLSGPLCLTIAAIYFHDQKISGHTIQIIIRAFTLPIISMLVYLSFTTIDLSLVEFDAHSNFMTSGGYGPNQVSMIFGYGVLMLILLNYYRQTFSGWTWLDYCLIVLLLFRALITFSRGGVLGAALALVVFLLLNMLGKSKVKNFGRRAVLYIVIGVGVYFLWGYTNRLTNYQLEVRYDTTQETGNGDQLTTGRLLLLQHDLSIFREHPVLGIGPGKSKLENAGLIGREVATHTEWTRMLAEHGSLGLISLFLLLGVPIFHSFRRQINLKPLLLTFFILALFSSTHSAMRVSAISFLYALSLMMPVKSIKTGRKITATDLH